MILNELSEIKGFTETTLQFLVQFLKEYTFESTIAKQAVSQLQDKYIIKKSIYEIICLANSLGTQHFINYLDEV